MSTPVSPLQEDGIQIAAEHGRICALATDCQRDLQQCTAEHQSLFSGNPFDPRLVSGVALANAFGSPWATADELRIACRSSLWVFAADWLVDYVAKSREEVDALAHGCLAVADGSPPSPEIPLTVFLAQIRDDLAAAPAFASLHPRWCTQLERYLTAMATEWDWQAARSNGGAPPPTFDSYLDNADNFGSTFVNVSHWIMTCEPDSLEHFDRLWSASGIVQRVLRLLNDLATAEREVTWGDLNALALGVSREAVRRRITALVAEFRDLAASLRADCPRETAYLERQIGYSTGFYSRTDYWGDL
ncbi:terpene synthase family protein [Actinomadura sp. 6N118]|uniref:terpene synthase family protein n=1 Tax=Actinomadura sp. 6N118 TaxID=3375151 RepID=UPI00379AA69E